MPFLSMLWKFKHKATFFLLTLFYTGFCLAQSGIRVNASVDKQSILIGERVLLKLEADIPENEPIHFFNIDTIDHFEFIRKGNIDTVNTSIGTRLSQDFLLTSFDSGQWVIPAYVLDAANNIQTDSFLVNVGYMSFDTSKPYNDVKDIIEVSVAEKKEDYWYYIAATATILILVLLYFLTKKKKTVHVEKKAISPFDEAMQELERIKRPELSAKEYYTRLTEIFRVFLGKKKNIFSMQKTTDELVVQMRSLKLEAPLYEQIGKALRLSDLVKFAKFEPSTDDDKNTFETIKRSVQAIENINE